MAVPKHHPGDERPTNAVAPAWHPFYDLKDASTVDAFVDRHPYLATLLEQAPVAIQQHFGDFRGLRLEVIADPDAGGAEHLYLFVRTAGRFEDVLRRRDRLDDEWWLEAMTAARGHLTVDLEFA